MISRKYYDWVSDSSGDAEVAIPDFKGYFIAAVRSVPGNEGDRLTNCPAAAYDLKLINNKTGADVLNGEGADRSHTVADDAIVATTNVTVPGAMTIEITLANNTAGLEGRVYIDFIQA